MKIKSLAIFVVAVLFVGLSVATSGAKTGSAHELARSGRVGADHPKVTPIEVDAATPSMGLSSSELEALGVGIGKCWVLQPSDLASKPRVELLIKLNIDGTLNGPPQVVNAGTSTTVQSVVDATLRAVEKCAPYHMFNPAAYSSWAEIDLILAADQTDP